MDNVLESGKSELLIDKLIDMIDNGSSGSLKSGKATVNRDEALLILNELKSILLGELRIYREVTDRKGKIITDAKEQAEAIIKDAHENASRIRVTKGMSSVGSGFDFDELQKDEKQALRTAGDIYASSLIYTDEMLTEVNDVIASAYDIINNQYGRMVKELEAKAKIVSDNKAELMASLKELSKEERYSQILDLSKLLSFELYNERRKAEYKEEKMKEPETKSETKLADNVSKTSEVVPEDFDNKPDSTNPFAARKVTQTKTANEKLSGLSDSTRTKKTTERKTVKLKESEIIRSEKIDLPTNDAVKNTLSMFARKEEK